MADTKTIKGSFHSQKSIWSIRHNDHEWLPEDKRDVEVTTYAYTLDLDKQEAASDDSDVVGVLSGITLADLTNIGEELIRDDELEGRCSADEMTFYERCFGKTLAAQNKRHRQARKYNRIKDMNEWRKVKQNSPTEDILQIGADGISPSRDVLKQCVDELMAWERKTLGRNYAAISLAGHFDEATPHYHKRGVFLYWNEDGLPEPCIKKALEQAGIPLPEPDKPESRTNCRKKTYDAMRREVWLDIIEKHLPKDFILNRNVEMDREFGHMSVPVYKELQKVRVKEQQTEQKADELERKEQEYTERMTDVSFREADVSLREKKASEREIVLDARETSLNAREAILDEQAKKNTSDAKQVLKQQMKVSEREKAVNEQEIINMNRTTEINEMMMALRNLIDDNKELIEKGKLWEQQHSPVQAKENQKKRSRYQDTIDKWGDMQAKYDEQYQQQNKTHSGL